MVEAARSLIFCAGRASMLAKGGVKHTHTHRVGESLKAKTVTSTNKVQRMQSTII